MANRGELNDKQIHRLTLEIARLLNGLSVGAAREVLSCAENLLQFSARFDIDARGFQEQLNAYNAAFGDNVFMRSGLEK